MKSSPAVDAYVRRAMRVPLLSRDEERALIERYQRGDVAAGQRVVAANLRFALKLAQRYAYDVTTLEDLVQEANLALMSALAGFRLGVGVRFITYANSCIRNRLLDFLAWRNAGAGVSLQERAGSRTADDDGQRDTRQDRLIDPSPAVPERIEEAEALARVALLVASVAVRKGARNSNEELRRRLRIVAEVMGVE